MATKSGMARLRQAFGATGVRVTCGAGPLLALRSRRSFKEISVSLPQQEIRPLAPSFSFRCGSCLEHRDRVSFGSKNAQCNGVLSLMALALYGVFERLRHAIGFRVTSVVASFLSLRGETFYSPARPKTSNPVSLPLRHCCQTEQVRKYPFQASSSVTPTTWVYLKYETRVSEVPRLRVSSPDL